METQKNFIIWLNVTMKSTTNNRAKISEDLRGEEQDGIFEGMSCSDLHKAVSVFQELAEWKSRCTTNDCSAGKFHAVTGNDSKMTVTRDRMGPFLNY